MSNEYTLAKLKELARTLASAPDRLTRGMGVASQEIRKLVAEEFSSGKNPWGRAWPAPKDGGAPLRRSGATEGSARVELVGGNIVARVGTKYSRYLQRGRHDFKRRGLDPKKGTKGVSKVMRPRAIVPTKSLPPSWRKAIGESLSAELGRTA